jgi:hypothetical protein
MSPNGSVVIITVDYGLDDRGLISVRGRNFYLCHHVQAISGTNHLSIKQALGGAKAAEA